jgi:hypothetical protein
VTDEEMRAAFEAIHASLDRIALHSLRPGVGVGLGRDNSGPIKDRMGNMDQARLDLGELRALVDHLQLEQWDTVKRLRRLEAKTAGDPLADTFAWTTLSARSTGLPVAILVSALGFAAIDPHGPKTAENLDAFAAWSALNRETLVAHWTGAIDSVEMATRLQKLTP